MDMASLQVCALINNCDCNVATRLVIAGEADCLRKVAELIEIPTD